MNEISKFGFYSSVSTAIVAAGTFAIAIFTPPLSGPLCAGFCFTYPFSDIASRFPRDYYWMYPAMLLSILFLMLVASLHQHASKDKKIYSHIGLILSSLGSGVLAVNYFLQVSVIPPSVLSGEMDGIAILSQFNPHGIFIVLEEAGYLLIGVAFLFLSFIFSGSKLARALKWTCLLMFALTLLALAGISLQYGIQREYRFEIAAIAINWTGLIVFGILSAMHFRKRSTEFLNAS